MEGMEGCAKFKIKMRRVVVISVPKFVLGNKKIRGGGSGFVLWREGRKS